MKQTNLPLLFAFCFFAFAMQAQQVIRLYPGAAPGSENWKDAEITDTLPGNVVILRNTSVPTLTVYRPASASGAAVVVCPGGAFRFLAVKHEGEDVARWLTTKGITAFVLKYRTMPGRPYPDPELNADFDKHDYAHIDEVNKPYVPLAIADGKAAISYLREHAAGLGIDADRIGMMGFSAGGTLTASVAMTAETANRPDFIAPIYAYIPAVPGGEVPADAPPMFLAYSADDAIAEGNLGFFKKWRTAGRSAELHVYAQGGHGYGLNAQNLPSDDWKEQLAEWLEIQGFFMTKARLANNDPKGSRGWREANQARNHADFGWLKRFEMDNKQAGLPKPNEQRVVFMGNSITEGWKNADPAFFENKPYINRGISGQTTPQMLLRFRQDVVDLKPAVVVILAGTNDIAGNTGEMTLEQTMDNIASMAELAKAHNIKVVLSSVLPAFDYPWKPGLEPAGKIVRLNQMIKDYCDKNGCVYLDYFTPMADERNGLKANLGYDGVHPNLEGYKVMEPLVEKAIGAALRGE